jgi:uncharacterized protein YdbL (DUF1318 family)
MLFLAHVAAAQFIQQGSKLAGAGVVDQPGQGGSVALSADGNTAIVGSMDGGWVFTRSGGVWSQQGNKLVGTGAVGASAQGYSVAISADGNTAITGGFMDNSNVGAAWVFTRSGGVWSQQGTKLVGTGAVGPAGQGYSVAISADGNTATVGGPCDNSNIGAAWVFTQSGGVWSQQGSKLVGTGAVGWEAQQGTSVAIAADGNTAVVGSYDAGAWVFTRSGGVWTEQGSKLIGIGAVMVPSQGSSVAISGDGNTVIVGGLDNNLPVSAAWVFMRSGGVWSQQGSNLVGTGHIVNFGSMSGASVAISADGNTAIVGEGSDNSFIGAAWVFTRSGGVWTQQGSKLVGTGTVGAAEQGYSVAISADGNTVIVGGPIDNSNIGAAWVFVATGCTSPLITSQPQSQSIVSGQTATLSVIASGTAPLSYRWYQGNAGDGLTPVGANASTFTTPPLESTTSYWVWVFNECGSTFSATATISVERRVRRHLKRAT